MQRIEIPISEEDFRRYERFHKKDKNHMKPFGFHDLEGNLFLLNHGTKTGKLWNEYLGYAQSLSEFINFIRKRMTIDEQNKEIILLCCHGGLINEKVQGVIIANRSIDELLVDPPCFCMDIDGNYTFNCQCSDGAFY